MRLPVPAAEHALTGQAKPGKREQPVIAKFKEETGVMNAVCYCKGHDLEGRTVYDLHEMDPEQNEVSAGVNRCWPPR